MAKGNAESDVDVAGAAAAGHTFETSDKARTVDNDILGAESLRELIVSTARAWNAKVDRDFENISRSLQTEADRIGAHADDVRALRHQHMQNAVENANFAAKQYLKTAKLGDDAMWNLNENSAIFSAVIAKLADMVKSTEGDE